MPRLYEKIISYCNLAAIIPVKTLPSIKKGNVMPRSKNLLCVIGIILLAASPVLPQKITDTTTAAKLKHIDNFIGLARDTLGIKTGLTISVVRGNSIIFEKAYGYSDIEKKVPATINTPFYIASSTKSFTAELTKILSDEGEIKS